MNSLSAPFGIPESPIERLEVVLDTAWAIFHARIISGRLRINKESSMQLHLAAIIHSLGEIYCTQTGELFEVELESDVAGMNLDLTCVLGIARAAIELKCFRKRSNRAVDTDMYDALKDIARLCSCQDFQIKRFICLSDNRYYAEGKHDGHASIVTIKNNTFYPSGTVINPTWAGRWKDSSRDQPINISRDVIFTWTNENGWYSLYQKL